MGCQPFNGLSIAPQILGGSPGSGPGSSSSTALGGGNKTVSRIARPFPLSFCANGFQHSEQILYSLPSMSFCRQSFASPQRSQIIMDSPPESRRNGTALPRKQPYKLFSHSTKFRTFRAQRSNSAVGSWLVLGSHPQRWE